MDEPGDAHISLGRVRMEDKASWMGCVDGEFQEKGRAGFLGGAPWVSVPSPFQLFLLPDTPLWGSNMASAEVSHKLVLSHPCLDTETRNYQAQSALLRPPTEITGCVRMQAGLSGSSLRGTL